ncbi:hypothetical protein ACNIRR_26445, partial [Escherichia coli]
KFTGKKAIKTVLPPLCLHVISARYIFRSAWIKKVEELFYRNLFLWMMYSLIFRFLRCCGGPAVCRRLYHHL